MCFRCTKPLACYDIKTTAGKEGTGTVSHKVQSCAAIPLSPVPLWRGRQGLSASAPSASGPICTSPSASPNLHSPICSIRNPTICKPGRADGKDTLHSGAPHSSLGSGEHSPVRSAEPSCPHHATLPAHAMAKHFLPCPMQPLQQSSTTSLTHKQRNGGRRKFPAGGEL